MNPNTLTHEYIKYLILPGIREKIDRLENLVSQLENDTNTVYGDYALMRDITELCSFLVGYMKNDYEFIRKADDAPEEDRPPVPAFLRHLRNNKKGE